LTERRHIDRVGFHSIEGIKAYRRFIKEVAAYPYDVVEEDEARKIGEKNPQNFLHVEKSEIDLPPKTDPNDDRVFSIAKNNLERLIKEGSSFRRKRPVIMSMVKKKETTPSLGLSEV